MTYLEEVNLARAEGEELSVRNMTRNAGRMNQYSRITVPDRKRWERNRSALTVDSEVYTKETDEITLGAGPTSMIAYQGTYVPTTYFPTGSPSYEV